MYFGHIRNGRVVPDENVPLPEGARVRIDPVADTDPADDLASEAVDFGVTDLAEQHDHYLYGTPKRPRPGGRDEGR